MDLIDLSRKLARGTIKSRDLVEQCLARIDDSTGEGERVFLNVYRERALAEAEQFDRARSNGWSVPSYAGIPLSIKDLFDAAGEVTRAGSKVLDEQPPATQDATIVRLLREAGFIILGKTNMTEFAYSGLGINEHFGTPLSPWDRATGHIPGGSSSGSAVSVADGMALGTMGTDTGGSCRIPAAFCGIVGFKPTSTRVSRDGVVPLSSSLDSVGPLATSVSSCAVLDDIISGGSGADVDSRPESGLRLGVIDNYVTDNVDDTVASAYNDALTRLSQRGVRLAPAGLDELNDLPQFYRNGGLAAAEAYAWHEHYIKTRPEFYDTWIRERIEGGRGALAADYIALIEGRCDFAQLIAKKAQQFDALVLPTVAIVPPTMASMDDMALRGAANQLVLRNTAVGNFLNRPSISIPCSGEGQAPVGFMLMGHIGADRELFSIARGLEYIIRPGA